MKDLKTINNQDSMGSFELIVLIIAMALVTGILPIVFAITLNYTVS